ncbi:MAG: sugar ABC transporter substrate-binding protein [Propionicimonas sp.]|uniref:sugar ABC transporter substrate-binding protein n=1 Tax=Propionicimonas sp. TaxID=1955623 RepID=UPI001DBF2769|nr:sugar ABC transporter substrate-binding protein [Propionicimonas sp.]MBU4186573.1 sugar ABC transporter substrate-binding protein [Actinomycetota bacterium]MBU4206231.1 sugar ABC transporter substrate-binding protein [Actinomycetota bacterium]MBU4250740.1 sugar ABC transporter substrate-binding protein [Actinomycetota bacterium]MBU4363335.1 sugar ABC transporter substrate-binding protein [Actinomycetota bacterium]MBU4411231.1 sugar ABC transporter substrate-binding protein [Actinomycetota b
MKKRYAVIAGAAALALTITGCGRAETPTGQGSAAGNPVNTGAAASGTLEVWAMGAEGDELKAVTDKFMTANPGVKVNVTSIPWSSAHDKFVSAAAANVLPDVAQVGTTWVAELAQQIDPTPSNFDTTKFLEGAQKTTVVNGTSLGVPWYVETRVVYYNKAVAAKAGVTADPTTWDEFFAMVKAMKEKGGAKYGISMLPGGEGSWQTVLPLMWSAGGKINTDDAKTWTFDDPKNVEGLKFYQDFFSQGLANKAPVGDTLVADFASGKVPMFISGPWMMSGVETTGKMKKDDYGVFAMPTKVSGASFIGGSNLAVFKSTKNRDTAWKLVDYLTQSQTQVEWFKTIGDLPSVKTALADPAVTGDAKFAVFAEQLKTAYAPPSVATWEQVAKQFDSTVEKVTRTGADPDASLKALQQQATSVGMG